MAADRRTMTAPRAGSGRPRTSGRLYREGMLAGCVGGATVALWFFLLDVLAGRPLYTPSLLGTALFYGAEGLQSPMARPISIEMVVAFSCVHWLVFTAIGGIATWLLTFAESNRYLGFGLLFLFLFLVFDFGFLAAAMFFSEVILRALDWKTVLLGNLLAAAAMGIYLWKRHPALALKDVSDTFFS